MVAKWYYLEPWGTRWERVGTGETWQYDALRGQNGAPEYGCNRSFNVFLLAC
jgi:hypothetical protein